MTSSAGTTSSVNLPPLPSKLWERIFLALTPLQLLRVRAVCRLWRNLVTNSRPLMGRFAAVLDGDQMDWNYRPPVALPVGCLQLAEFRILGTGLWWTGFGPGLTELRLYGCTMAVAVFYEMLQKTPHLKRLEINDSGFPGYGAPNFRLESMECFMLDNPNCLQLPHDLIDNVERAFPRLKELRLLRGATKFETKSRLVESVRKLQATLEYLEIPQGDYMELLCQVDGLRLKEFSGHIDFSSNAWDLFYRKQLGIEKLLVTSESCQKLQNIGRSLPNLKYLPLDLSSSMKADFLNDMPNLENIDLNGHLKALSFRSASNPKLNHFHAINTTATHLIQYLQKSPDLAHLNLHECTLIGDSADPGNFPKLRNLLLSKCNLPPTLTLALCLQNPQLQCLHLRFLPCLTDDQFALICETVGPNLRELAVIQCGQLTDAAGDCIVGNCLALEKLRLHGFALSEQSGELLAERHASKDGPGRTSGPNRWVVSRRRPSKSSSVRRCAENCVFLPIFLESDCI